MKITQEGTIDNLLARAASKAIPLNVLFELTHRCNLRCDHCYVAHRSEEELELDEIKDILDQLAAANTLFLTFSGGEVLLRKDFFDIARHARKRGFALKVFTNGTCIDERIAHEMAGLQPIQVGISIYGSNAATHDGITGVPSSFDRSVRALKLLKDQGIVTTMKCLLMKENFAQLKDIEALSGEVGAILNLDPVVSPRNDGDRNPTQHEMGNSDLYQLFSLEADFRLPPKYNVNAGSLVCHACFDNCSISPWGEVNPCVSFPMPLGDLRRHRFIEIWDGPIARLLRSYRYADLKECARCDDREWCRRCWGLAFVESGDHLGTSPLNCRVARVRHRISVERSESGQEAADEATV